MCSVCRAEARTGNIRSLPRAGGISGALRRRRGGRHLPGVTISRIWHGWTTPANADAYETLLRTEIFHGIAARQISGFRGIELLRRRVGDEVEFVTIMWFDSLDAVRAFAGEGYEQAVVAPAAQAALRDYERRVRHYTIVAGSGMARKAP